MKGTADVAQVMKKLAATAGLQFENNDINVKLANPYLPGTTIQQIKAIAKYAGIEHIIDLNTLAIWNHGQARSGDAALVSPQTGLKYGGTVQLESSITPASGKYIINRIDYDLASQMPRGPWFCDVTAYNAALGEPPVS